MPPEENPRTFDPGLTERYGGRLRRILNTDGTFNVHRRGVSLRDLHVYRFLLGLSWPLFLGVLAAGFLVAGTLYTGLYLLTGVDGLTNAEGASPLRTTLNTFFFSIQTLTTVGYGAIAPHGLAAQIISSLEAMTGVLGFAFGAGLLYGRFSRPSARVTFSRQAVVAPYRGGTSLQFRLVNQRSNVLTELSASVILMTVEGTGEDHRRKYLPLELERDSIFFFPLTWTVVHPIDEKSPLFGTSATDLEAAAAEIFVLIKGFDDTFSQTVHARYSYRAGEILWGHRFTPAFGVDERGDLVLRVDEVHATQVAPLPGGP